MGQYNRFHSDHVMQSTWLTVVANAMLEFSGKLDFRFLHKTGC